jgi:hypothetical protein
MVSEVLRVTQHWREAATRLGIAKAEIQLMTAAFALSEAR